jgi:regulator of replication initiation timing
MSAKPRPAEETPERLRDLQRKFTAGTATPAEKLAWLAHLKSKAQHQRDDARVLTLVQQIQTVQQDDTAQATQPLPCPDGSPRQLMWLRTTDVRARRAPALPAPDSDAVKELAASIAAQGVLQNLVLGPERDVIIGEGRRQAARMAGLPYVPALVLTEVSDDERELTALAAELFARPRLSLQHLTRYRAAYRAVTGKEFGARDPRTARAPDTLTTAVDLVQAYQHMPDAVQQEVIDMILEGNAAREAIRTTFQEHSAHSATAPQVQTLRQRIKELDHRLATVEGERNHLQDTAQQLDTQLGRTHVQLTKARDDVTSLAKSVNAHKHEATTLTRELRGLRERLAQLRPLEQLAETPHTVEVMGEAVHLIELVYRRLLGAVTALLDTASAPRSAQECARVLDDIVVHATACKRAITKLSR